MAERWPASMPFMTACEYLGVKETVGRQILNQIPAMTHDIGKPNHRGERYWAKSVLDDYIERRCQAPVSSQAA